MKVLFINHSADRTGAPIVLLHFLKWLKQNESISFDVLTLQNGDLIDEFTKVSNRHYFNTSNVNIVKKIKNYLKKQLKLNDEYKFNYPIKKLDVIAKNDYDLIYANTVVSISISSYLKLKAQSKPKLLVHFHELNLVIHTYCPELLDYKNSIDTCIAASEKVKQNLVTNWGFAPNLVKVVYEHSVIQKQSNEVTNDFIVGASGLVNWRKGPDYFILVADYVFKKSPNLEIKFQWVGKISKINRMIYEEDIKKLKLMNKVEFVGLKQYPQEYYSKFDVFLMTSKEDPFPLVCIEVGMLSKPILCFEGATGTEEVLKSVEGTVVPYLDIAKMGDAIIRYYNDESLRKDHGRKIRDIFQEFTPEKQGRKLYEIMNNLILDKKRL